MRKILTVLPILLSGFCFSQKKYDTAQYDIIKQAVVLYAADPISFGEEKKPQLTCAPMQYSCLQSYCTDNKLTSVWSNISAWRQKFPCNSKADLQILTDSIQNALLHPGKTEAADFRKKNISLFAGYADSIIRTISDNGSTYPTPLGAAAQAKDDSTANEEPAATTPTETKSSLPLIALIVAVVSLLGVMIGAKLIMDKFHDVDERAKRRKSEIESLETRVRESNTNLSTHTSKTVQPFEDRIKQLEDKIIALEKKLRAGSSETMPKANPAKEVAGQLPNKKIMAPIAANRTLYAKLPDLSNGSGFSDAMLSSSQNGEQIYEIKTKGNDSATFTISGDARAQKYALTDYNHYLAQACDFINQPSPNCRIHTKVNGTLTNNGNNWMIHEKAKIEFV